MRRSFASRIAEEQLVIKGDRCNSCPAPQSWSMQFTTIPCSLNLNVNQPNHPNLAGHHPSWTLCGPALLGFDEALHAEWQPFSSAWSPGRALLFLTSCPVCITAPPWVHVEEESSQLSSLSK